jgi:hypothetical protein
MKVTDIFLDEGDRVSQPGNHLKKIVEYWYEGNYFVTLGPTVLINLNRVKWIRLRDVEDVE